MDKNRWTMLMQAFGIERSFDTYQALCDAYAEKHRHYHTDQHIKAMLAHFDSVSHLVEYPAELELAIWFHDAIYKPMSKTNELDSARWARDFLSAQNFDVAGKEHVFNLIMATEHNGHVYSNDEKLMVDIDLSILGTPEHTFEIYEKNVREEYRWVPWFLYRKKRKEVLRSFLESPSIYQTKIFKEKFEAIARINICRSIESL